MNISQGWRRWLLFCLGLVLFSNTQAAVDDIRTSSFFFEFLSFKSSSPHKTFLEVFCQIPTDNLHFVNADDGIVARYSLTLELVDPAGQLVEMTQYDDSLKVRYADRTSTIPAWHLFRLVFNISPGDYSAKIRLIDRHSNWQVNFNRDLAVPDYDADGLQMSDIQLASNIYQTDEESVLVKNHKKIIPHLSHVFGIERKKLYAYTEIYKLDQSDDNLANKFSVTYQVLDQAGTEVRRLNYKFDKPGATAAFGAGLRLEGLETGQYTLIVEIQDLDNFEVQRKAANFHVINSKTTYSDAEFATLLRQLRYIAHEYEIDYLAEMSEPEREVGLQRFWMARDPVRETSRNEIQIDFYHRLYFANLYFTIGEKQGWETDQGKVYVTHGSPDRIDRLTSSTDNNEYEVWNYANLDLKYIFVENSAGQAYKLIKTVDSVAQEFTLH